MYSSGTGTHYVCTSCGAVIYSSTAACSCGSQDVIKS